MSRHLLTLLINAFVPAGDPLVFGLDETIERRWGARIAKRGIYRDAVRSSRSHLVKCSGLRWMALMLLTPLPWLKKGVYWALPFLTALCPSERYYSCRGKRKPKKLTDWARQLLGWLGRYVTPLGRRVYLVGDGSYATYELMRKANETGIGLVSRLKFNARLFHLPKAKPPGKRGRNPLIGGRILGMEKRLTDRRINWQTICFSEWYGRREKKMDITTGVAIWDSNKGYRVKVRWVLVRDPEGQLDPVLLATNDTTLSAIDVVRFFVRRWRVEVTFAEVRRHLGVESQRQWSNLAIERVTPVLMALTSVVCLLAVPLHERGALVQNQAAWYRKEHYTFSDILLSVRRKLWPCINLPTSPRASLVGKLKQRISYLQQTLALAVA